MTTRCGRADKDWKTVAFGDPTLCLRCHRYRDDEKKLDKHWTRENRRVKAQEDYTTLCTRLKAAEEVANSPCPLCIHVYNVNRGAKTWKGTLMTHISSSREPSFEVNIQDLNETDPHDFYHRIELGGSEE